MIKIEPLQNQLMVLVLICYPSIVLTIRGGMGWMFFLLFILSLISLYRARGESSSSYWDKYSIAFALAMASPVLAIFLSQAFHGQFKAPYYDWASRFLLAIPIFLALRQISFRMLAALQIGFPLGALITFIALIHHPFNWETRGDLGKWARNTTSNAFNLIHFSNIALMLGMLSLFSINLTKKDHFLVLLLKFGCFLAGIYMSIQAGERSSWVVIPLLLLLWAISHNKKQLKLKVAIASLVICSFAWASYNGLDHVHLKVDQIFQDWDAFKNGNKDTSIGIRLQQWHAATYLFLENPIFGVGPGGAFQAMTSLSQQGNILTPEAAKMASAELHSEIFAKLAETGLLGLLSLFLIYLISSIIFWRAIHFPSPISKKAGFMGLCLVIGFVIFGLTAEVFNLKMTASFFSLTLAILAAAALHENSYTPVK